MRKTQLLETYISTALLSSEVQYLPIYLLTCERPYPIVIIFNTASSLGILQIHCGFVSLKHTVEFIPKGKYASLWSCALWINDQIQVEDIQLQVKRNEGLSCLRKTKANDIGIMRRCVWFWFQDNFFSHSLTTISQIGLY